jgi:hypothetical protein
VAIGQHHDADDDRDNHDAADHAGDQVALATAAGSFVASLQLAFELASCCFAALLVRRHGWRVLSVRWQYLARVYG